MSYIYNNLQYNFREISSNIILDNRISGTAKAIYCYIIMRLSQNKDEEFYDYDIQGHLKEKRDAFRSAKRELLLAGYLTKIKQNIDKEGKYKGCDYAIHSEPIIENP